ncbi:helix-turn-helix domain-containing protein [Flagellimonas onchidii]|uniref:helix-turn-helix domain-containing protein n=1 Tax=Flagellimonas onchidii TaxID=2562684 RepID=UPI0014561E4A|nr:AraC family transcriptional regulator [Allomuricauda onchidii]
MLKNLAIYVYTLTQPIFNNPETDMLASLNFWNTILALEAVFAFVLFVFLIKLSIKTKVYLPLLVFTFLSFAEFTILALIHFGAIEYFPHLIYINEPFFMLFGLLLFLYARSQVYQQFFFRKNDLLFFVPFVLAFITYLPDFLETSTEKLALLSNEGDTGFDIVQYIWEWNFYLVVNIFFLVRAMKELRVYDFKLKAQHSNIKDSSLYFTQLLIKVCLGFYIVELVFVYLTYYGFPHYNQIYLSLNLLTGIVLLLVNIDAIKSHRQIFQNQLSQIKLPVITKNELGKREIKYASSGLNEESSKKIEVSLLQFMEERKPYLEPQLRIKDLSALTEIPVHHISQVLNQSFDKNFYEFINEYRIKEAMRLLKNPKYQDYTYESIAFEVGFNSRSAFYNAFKKINNTTPSRL